MAGDTVPSSSPRAAARSDATLVHILHADPPGRTLLDLVAERFPPDDEQRLSSEKLIPARPDLSAFAGDPNYNSNSKAPKLPAEVAAAAGISSSSDAAVRLLLHDTLAIRRQVFCLEQGYPWADELEPEDAQCWHFSAIRLPSTLELPASSTGELSTNVTKLVLSPRPSNSDSSAVSSISPDDGGSSTAPAPIEDAAALANLQLLERGTALATVRLVAGPFPAHPLPGTELISPPSAAEAEAQQLAEPYPASVKQLPGHRDVSTAFHDGHELYIKITRVATLLEARGQGLARRLMEAAMAFAVANPALFDRRKAAVAETSDNQPQVDKDKEDIKDKGHDKDADNVAHENDDDGYDDNDDDDVGREWRGLVCVHAQTHAVPLYLRCGFAVDTELGSWTEMGVPHVAMWKRVAPVGRSSAAPH